MVICQLVQLVHNITIILCISYMDMYSFMSHVIFNHLHKPCLVIEVCTIIYNICTWVIQNDTQMISRKIVQVMQI